MEKRTYGVERLVDWVAEIKVGSAKVKVHFTGGALTTLGVTPAEYTTSNPFMQRVIEQSDYYKSGRIKLLRRIVVETEGQKKRTEGQKRTEEQKKGEEQKADSSLTGEREEQEKPVEGEADNSYKSDNSDNSNETEVKVTCLQDAQAYLQEEYGIATYKVRTCEAAQKAGKEHGVRFTGAKFDELGAGE